MDLQRHSLASADGLLFMSLLVVNAYLIASSLVGSGTKTNCGTIMMRRVRATS